MGWQDDPVVGGSQSSGGGGWQSDPIVGGAKTAQPSNTDYSNSPWSARLRTLLSSGSLGASDLIGAGLQGTSVAQQRAMDAAAAQSLPWYERYPIEAAGYGFGAGALLTPVGEAAAAGAAGTGVGEALGLASGLGRTAVSMGTQGAAAGGISSGLQGENPISGAASGALLGAGAGALTRGANVGLQKALGTKATVNFDDAVNQTETAKKAAYGAIEGPQAPTFGAQPFTDAYINPINTLTNPQKQDVSDAFMKKMQNHVDEVQQQGSVSAGDIDGYARSLQNAANTDAEKILAARVRDNLVGKNGVLATAPTISGHPVGQAYGMLQDAKTANAQFENAQALRQLQQQLDEFGQGPGSVPQTQAETYYKVGDPERTSWANIARAGKPGLDPSFVAGHLGSEIGESILGLFAGVPGLLAGKALGYLGGKMIGKKTVAGMRNRALSNAYQAEAPTLTGVQPTGGVQGPQVGEGIKNLLMGAAY